MTLTARQIVAQECHNHYDQEQYLHTIINALRYTCGLPIRAIADQIPMRRGGTMAVAQLHTIIRGTGKTSHMGSITRLLEKCCAEYKVSAKKLDSGSRTEKLAADIMFAKVDYIEALLRRSGYRGS
jgi:hypothetical protein